jgi:hypothetical protein
MLDATLLQNVFAMSKQPAVHTVAADDRQIVGTTGSGAQRSARAREASPPRPPVRSFRHGTSIIDTHADEESMGAKEDMRGRLGLLLIGGSAFGLVIIAVLVVFGATRSPDPESVYKAAQLLLASLLPMFGTWVGTVLAFYYSKENYEAASRGTLDLVRTVAQKLTVTPVTAKMMPRAQIIAMPVPAQHTLADLPVSDIQARFRKTGANGLPISRLLIVDSSDICVAMLHRSVFMEAVAIAQADNPPLDLTNATLGDLLGRPCAHLPGGGTYLNFIQNTFACVARDRTLADAKAAMEQLSGCQDVVITQTGKRSEAILGWLSNIDIGRMSEA